MSVVRFHLRPPLSPHNNFEVTVLDTNAINLCVETLCNDGCRMVNEYIVRLEAGESLPQTSQLAPDECAEVLRELKEIMAVYEANGSCKTC